MKFNASLRSSSFSSLSTLALLAFSFVAEVNGETTISLGWHQTCTLEHTSNELKCWGKNAYYQLNTGDTKNHSSPITISFPGIVPVYVQVGLNIICVIDNDGVISCIGRNRHGQFGNGTNNVYGASPVTSMTGLPYPAVKVFTGYRHACMIDTEGNLWCSGRNSAGQLGLGDTTNYNTPTRVALLPSSAVDASAGKGHTCIINDQARLWCMGKNKNGQLGLGHFYWRKKPTEVTLPADKNAVKVVCGGHHTCFLDNQGELWCMGRNDKGQLGLGDWANKNVPSRVSLENNSVEIAAGHFFSCLIDDLNKLWCMGQNDYGQLGTGNTNNSNIPLHIALPESPVDISLGLYHACISTIDSGRMYCWGRNKGGSLGLGDKADRYTPTLVSIDWSKPSPTESPTESLTASFKNVSDYATVVCGGSPYKCNPQREVALKTDTYGVRCCNDTVFPASRKNPDCNVWGGSKLGDPRGCKMSATFQQAVNYCAVSGARLCTKDELLNKCAKSTGCGLNRVLVWSSEPAALTS